MHYSEDMVTGQMLTGLANSENQSRIFAEAASLVSLEKKLNRLVCLKTTDKSTPHFQDAMHPLASSNVQKSEKKRTPQETETQSTPRYIKPCSGCGKISHPGGGRSMNQKDCPAVKLKCWFCGMTGYMKKVCWKFTKSEADETSRTLKSEESFMFTNSTPR